MIQEFRVSNFCSIREMVSLNFLPSSDTKMEEYYTCEVAPGVRLLKLGIIYGSNASGKTTVLKALSFFRNFMVRRPDDKLRDMEFQPFMLDRTSRDRNTSMGLTFFIDTERYVLECEFNSNTVLREELKVYASSRPTLLYKRTYAADTGLTTISFGSKSCLSKRSQQTIVGNTINNCSVIAALGQSNIEASRLDKVFKYFSTNILDMLNPKEAIIDKIKAQLKSAPDSHLKSFILQVLHASDFNIVDFQLIEKDAMQPNEMLIFTHIGDGGEFVLNEGAESSGTTRFMGISLILYQLLRSNCFLAIDEVETSIHYELLSYFIKLFLVNSEGTSQLLLTTHDINLLDENFIRRDVIWFTEKNPKGVTSLKRLSASGLHKSLSVYNAYKQGKLVELPFLGSIFLDY